MITKVQKWGNSLAIRLPKSLAKESRLREGSEIALGLQDGNIILSRSAKPHYTLKELLKGVNKKNRHGEFDWGKPVGREIW